MTQLHDDDAPAPSYTRAEWVFFGVAAVLILAWTVAALAMLYAYR